MSKKAQTTLDVLLMIVVLFIVVVGFIVGLSVFSEINDDLQAEADFSAEAKAAVNTTVDQFPTWGDNIIIFLMVLFWILLLVTSFLIDTHPVFFIVVAIFLVFTFLIAMMISNTYEEIADDPDLSAYSAEFPKSAWVMDNLLIITIIVGLSTSLALFAKSEAGL